MPGGRPQPLAQVRDWFALARAEGVPEPEAAALATATPDGRPSVRMVLVRGIDDRGVAFYTNRESRKGRELTANPFAAIAVHWHALQRQIRLEGAIEVLPEAESDAYFASREPRQPDRRVGVRPEPPDPRPTRRWRRASSRSGSATPATVPRPPHWGGYLLAPGRGRVLAGPAEPAARARPVPSRG